MNLTGLAEKVFELAIVSDRAGSRLLVAGGDQGRINVWDIATGERVKEPRTDSRPVTQFAFSPAMAAFAAADDRGKITLWDTGSWAMMVLSQHPEPAHKVGLLGFGGRGSFLLRGADDLTVWDLDIASLRSKVCDILGAGKAASLPMPGRTISEACN